MKNIQIGFLKLDILNRYRHLNKVLPIIFLSIISLNKAIAKDFPPSVKPKGPAGYMGLWDWGVDFGGFNKKTDRPLIAQNHEYIKEHGQLLFMHFQENMLSNYFWAHNQDKRFKFGVIEKLEMGLQYATTKTTNTVPSNPTTPNRNRLDFLFAYEGGIGGVYKINDKMDAGFSYYFISISSFNNRDADFPHYAKFRFRYSHLMTELSTLGKNALDVKYLRKGVEDRSYTPYIGFSYSGWKSNYSTIDGPYSKKAHYLYFTIGGIF